ncbi:hypothetical protein Dimus_008463 [Dionaea muscipula]
MDCSECGFPPALNMIGLILKAPESVGEAFTDTQDSNFINDLVDEFLLLRLSELGSALDFRLGDFDDFAPVKVPKSSSGATKVYVPTMRSVSASAEKQASTAAAPASPSKASSPVGGKPSKNKFVLMGYFL